MAKCPNLFKPRQVGRFLLHNSVRYAVRSIFERHGAFDCHDMTAPQLATDSRRAYLSNQVSGSPQ